MANKIKFGLSNVHYAKITEVSEGGVPTYGAIKRIPGAVNLALDPEGTSEPFYADNIEYWISSGNNGYSGSEVDLHLFDAFESSYRLFCIGLAMVAAQAFYTICPDRAFTFLILTSAVILVSESEDHGIYQKQGHDYAAADAEPV